VVNAGERRAGTAMPPVAVRPWAERGVGLRRGRSRRKIPSAGSRARAGRRELIFGRFIR
jgi:hypothetical protein